MSTAVRPSRTLGLLGRPDARSVAGIAVTVLLLNSVGWGVLLFVVVPERLFTDGDLFGAGLGVTAFLLGARHAFDADHITAIDNTVRKLVGEHRPALTVGLGCALGHSSVVFALSLLLTLGMRTVIGPLTAGAGVAPVALALGSAIVAAGFLLLVGLHPRCPAGAAVRGSPGPSG